jgi:hypothetical protein
MSLIANQFSSVEHKNNLRQDKNEWEEREKFSNASEFENTGVWDK